MIIFDDLFYRVISLWPEEILVSEKTVHDNGGASIPSLTLVHDEIEEKILLIADNYELRQMDWAIYTALHQMALTQDSIILKNIDLEVVRRIFEENMND